MPISISNTVTDESGRELLEYGTADFPIAFYNDNLDYVAVPWHWHPEFELILVTQGKERVHAGGQSFDVQAGEAYFINGSILHAAEPLETSTTQHAMVFNAYVLGDEKSVYYQKYLQPLLMDETKRVFHLKADGKWQSQAISSLETAWQAGSKDEPGCELKIRNCLSDIIWTVFTHSSDQCIAESAATIRDMERIKRMLSYLEQHYDESVTLEQIAESAAVCVSEALRCFRRTVHQTPIQFLKNMRLLKSADLLAGTDLPVHQIAEACGFQDMSYYAREFRKLKGCTPVEFRNRVRLL